METLDVARGPVLHQCHVQRREISEILEKDRLIGLVVVVDQIFQFAAGILDAVYVGASGVGCAKLSSEDSGELVGVDAP